MIKVKIEKMYTDQINILNNAKNQCEIYVDICFN